MSTAAGTAAWMTRGGCSSTHPPNQWILNLLEQTLEFFFDCEDDHSLAKGYIPKLSALAPREKPSILALRRAA